MKVLFLLVAGCLLMISCDTPRPKTIPFEDAAYKDISQDLQTKLILAKAGDTIRLDEGLFVFSRSLSVEGKDSITIIGAGMDRTILSFHAQTEGAEGVRIQNGNNITLQDLTIRDAAGDNLKVQDVDGLRLLRVKSEWTGVPEESNGAYALYPVMCSNVLIDGCVAIGASDAGIYVGQSNHVIVRNSEAYNNVAGIEIENTKFADVHNNKAYENTGGILVFDLPGLSQAGGSVRVFDNEVTANNFRNFAPKGNIVASVPPGTGVMVLASREVEVFGNTIRDNRTAGVSVISYEFVLAAAASENSGEDNGQMDANEAAYKSDTSYNPFPSEIYIHDNLIEDNHTLPSFQSDIGYLLVWQFGLSIPDMLWDGITAAGSTGPVICLKDNGSASFANMDAGNEFEGSSKDPAPFTCEGKVVEKVELDKKVVAWLE